MTEKRVDWIDRSLNIGLLAILCYLLVSPTGPVRWRLEEAWKTRQLQSRAIRSWDDIRRNAPKASGGPGSEMRIVEFGDYECAYCRRSYSELAAAFGGDSSIAVGFRYFPLADLHQNAERAASAAICADAQGVFSRVHEYFFTSLDWQGATDQIPPGFGDLIPDSVAFKECLGGTSARAALDRDIALGRRLGVRGTPTFFFKRGVHEGFLDREGLKALLAGEL